MWAVLLMLLALYSFRDITRKKLPVLWLMAGILAAMVLGTLGRMQESGKGLWNSLMQVLLAMVPGMVLMALAFLLKEKMGSGDGMVLSVIGGLTDIKCAVAILMTALIIAFVYSGILIIICKKEKTYCFPFVPFYFLGSIILYAGMYLG